MKKNWNEEFLPGMEGLTSEELRAMNGGESLWYWIAYGLGGIGYMIKTASPVQSGGQKLMNAALG